MRVDSYTKTHLISKLIVACVVIALMLLARKTTWFAFDVLAIFIWFFGVNPVAYIIESVLRYKHKHNLY